MKWNEENLMATASLWFKMKRWCQLIRCCAWKQTTNERTQKQYENDQSTQFYDCTWCARFPYERSNGQNHFESHFSTTHTHSLTIPFMMTNVFAQFIRCERVLHIMKRNLWIHLLRLGDSSPNGPKQTILEVMNKKKGWKRKWNKCIKLCNNNDEGHAASLQSEIMCARMRWANNLESNRKRYKTNENKNLKILHWNYLCCLRVWWMGTRAQRFLFIIYCVNSISILCTWAFKELWLALCDRCFFFSPYTKHMEITNNLHIFSQMNTAADHRMLRNEYFWILSGVFLFDSSRL